MKEVKYLILGAGVSGLSFAGHIPSEDYLILEKADEPGGYCRTIRSGEYVWDYAGHFFHFSHPRLKRRFEEITDSDETVRQIKNTKIYYKGAYVDYPFQKNIHQLDKDEMIDCLYDLFHKAEKSVYESFLDMLYGKFGKSITEKFLRPYNEKLYACGLNTLDVDAMGRFFPYADIKDIINNMKVGNNVSYNQEFLYPKKGAAVFVDKLIEALQPDRLRFHETVLSVDTRRHIVRTDKAAYQYQHLISSIPLNDLVKIADIRDHIEENVFSYNQVLVLNLGFDRPSVDRDIHWIYVPSKEVNFYRVGFYNNIIGTDCLSLYIEIGYEGGAVISEEDIRGQLDLTLRNLRAMDILREHALVDHRAIVMNPAYVHITQAGQREVNRIKEMLEARQVYTVGRYGDWKYCSIEDCMVDAMQLADKLKPAAH